MNIIARAEELKAEGTDLNEAKRILLNEFPGNNQLGNILYKLWVRPKEVEEPMTQEEVDAIMHYFPRDPK